MKDIYIVCVLYNKLIAEIGSYQAFVEISTKYDHVHFLVVDNSSEKFVGENQAYADICDDVSYVSCGGNVGLSRAYNHGLDYIKSKTSEAFMLIADDDTSFSIDFLENIVSACQAGKAELFSGIIRDGNGKCLSPNTAYDWLGRDKYAVKKSGIYQDIYCFNSGVCIDIGLLQQLGGFDESLFVDMVDYWLMDSLKALGKNKFCIVEGEILQDFSAGTFEHLDSVIRRYQIFKKDFQRYCDLCHKSKSFRWYYGNRRKINVLVHVMLKGRFDLVKEL